MRRLAALAVIAGAITAACANDGDSEAAPRCDLAPVTTPVPEGYGGRLLDAHVHLDDPSLAAPLACSAQRERVRAVVLVTEMDPDEPLATQASYLTTLGDLPGSFLPAFHVDPTTPSDATAERVAAVFNEAGLLFVGVGEFDLAAAPWSGTSLLDEPWPGLFDLADRRDFFLIVAPRRSQVRELDRMLTLFPGAKVLVTAAPLRADLPRLLRSHDNLFVAVTAPGILRSSDGRPLQHEVGGPEEFRARFDAEWEDMLARAVEDWRPVVDAAPERVVWGSDATRAWHGEPEVYARIAAFTRAFLDRLPADARGAVAVANARRLLGVPAPLQPDA